MLILHLFAVCLWYLQCVTSLYISMEYFPTRLSFNSTLDLDWQAGAGPVDLGIYRKADFPANDFRWFEGVGKKGVSSYPWTPSKDLSNGTYYLVLNDTDEGAQSMQNSQNFQIVNSTANISNDPPSSSTSSLTRDQLQTTQGSKISSDGQTKSNTAAISQSSSNPAAKIQSTSAGLLTSSPTSTPTSTSTPSSLSPSNSPSRGTKIAIGIGSSIGGSFCIAFILLALRYRKLRISTRPQSEDTMAFAFATAELAEGSHTDGRAEIGGSVMVTNTGRIAEIQGRSLVEIEGCSPVVGELCGDEVKAGGKGRPEKATDLK